MIDTTARTSLKRRLDIDASDITFDAQLDEFVLAGVSRLYPIAQKEVARVEQDITVDSYGEAVFNMTTAAILAARAVEVYAGGAWTPHTDTYHHGTSLILRDLTTSYTKARVYGTTSFVLADVPSYLEQAVLWFAMSEFYDFLSGNKRKYNLYSMNGARAVDNMKDEADFYEQKANVYLNDRVQLYGLS